LWPPHGRDARDLHGARGGARAGGGPGRGAGRPAGGRARDVRALDDVRHRPPRLRPAAAQPPALLPRPPRLPPPPPPRPPRAPPPLRPASPLALSPGPRGPAPGGGRADPGVRGAAPPLPRRPGGAAPLALIPLALGASPRPPLYERAIRPSASGRSFVVLDRD